MATTDNSTRPDELHRRRIEVAGPFDGLLSWGDQLQRATGITPADIDRAVKRVRQDEAKTPPSPMDAIRSTLTDIEAAMNRGDAAAVDAFCDVAVDALLGLQERYKRDAGTWTVDPDMQSSSVLAAELPELPPSLVAMHQAGVLRVLHEDLKDNS